MLESASAETAAMPRRRPRPVEWGRLGGEVEIFLTGATGYLGGRIADRLLAAGHTLRLLYRSTGRQPLERAGVLPVQGDLERPNALRDAIRGVDAIVHTAAMVKSWVPDPAIMEAVNVDAVRSLIDAATSLGIPKMVYTSSFMALGPSNGRPLSESDAPDRTGFHNHYERTKYLGDQVARRAQAEGARLVILYPTVIFGPGPITDGNHVGKIIRDYLRGRLPGRLGRGDARWNYAFVDDVVHAHLLALEQARPGSRYIIGGENVSMDEFLATLEAISGVRAPTRRIPRHVAKGLAHLLVLASRFTGAEPDLTPEVVDIYERSWTYETDAAARELGYAPTPFREALARTVEWAQNALEERHT